MLFLSGWIPGLFFRDERVIGLSHVLRSPRIPLGIGVENRELEIAGLESRSGLKMGDFTGNSGHEGRLARQGPVNAGFSAFHEGRSAGKVDPPGGHDLVNRKKVTGKTLLIPIKAEILATLGYLLATHVLLRVQRGKFNGRPGESMNWE